MSALRRHGANSVRSHPSQAVITNQAVIKGAFQDLTKTVPARRACEDKSPRLAGR